MVWKIPEGGLTENIEAPVVTLAGHGRKVGHVLFNPVADNILLTTSADFLVKVWDISTGQETHELTGHGEIINSVAWNWNGNLLVTACKDKMLRLYDVRAKKAVQEVNGHQGVKGSRCVWMGNSDKIATTGFSKTSDRQVFVWDSLNLSSPLKQEQIDTASGMLIPYYDGDTSMLYLAGKGDGNIRYYEWSDDDKGLYFLSEYKSTEPQRGIGFLPKRAVNVGEVEIARAFKVHPGLVEPISFKVPRRSDAFQNDLYPDTVGSDPAMTSEEWIGGKECNGPELISLETGFVPPLRRDFTTSATPSQRSSAIVSSSYPGSRTPSILSAPGNEKEYQDAYHSLRKENDDLKSILVQRDIKIRQLESQLEALKK